jgi:RNA polymerase sigma-70 factor (ECF subfamily)
MADRAEPDRREATWISRVVVFDDHEAFAELVRLHQSPVRQFLRRLTAPDQERADDLAQETFWKAYRHIATFEGRGRFLGWLFRIAFQLFITEERKRRGVSHVPLTDETLPERVDEAATLIARRTFDQLMDALGPDERAAVVLHYRHAMSHGEIAETLQLPLGTVKTLIRRARLRLQQTYRPVSSEGRS